MLTDTHSYRSKTQLVIWVSSSHFCYQRLHLSVPSKIWSYCSSLSTIVILKTVYYSPNKWNNLSFHFHGRYVTVKIFEENSLKKTLNSCYLNINKIWEKKALRESWHLIIFNIKNWIEKKGKAYGFSCVSIERSWRDHWASFIM